MFVLGLFVFLISVMIRLGSFQDCVSVMVSCWKVNLIFEGCWISVQYFLFYLWIWVFLLVILDVKCQSSSLLILISRVVIEILLGEMLVWWLVQECVMEEVRMEWNLQVWQLGRMLLKIGLVVMMFCSLLQLVCSMVVSGVVVLWLRCWEWCFLVWCSSFRVR